MSVAKNMVRHAKSQCLNVPMKSADIVNLLRPFDSPSRVLV
jgi:hypothetical protein